MMTEYKTTYSVIIVSLIIINVRVSDLLIYNNIIIYCWPIYFKSGEHVPVCNNLNKFVSKISSFVFFSPVLWEISPNIYFLSLQGVVIENVSVVCNWVIIRMAVTDGTVLDLY